MAEEKEKSAGKKLEEELTWNFPHIGQDVPEQVDEAAVFCEGYKAFLDKGKTERECVKLAVEMLKKAGYQEFDVTRRGESICAPLIRTPSFSGFSPKVVINSAFSRFTWYTLSPG